MRTLHNMAIKHTLFGKPTEVLFLTKAGMPSIQSNEVLIQLKARSINPSDLLSVQGVGPYQKSVKLPAVPGFEGVGIVVEKGKDVLSPNIGDRIVSMKMTGSWQEFVTLPAEEALSVPEKIADNYAAQLCINPLTAWLIINKYALKKGDIVVGNAANSTMGKLFAQFSTVFGYIFIGIVRREIHIAPLLKLGAGLVVHSEDKDYATKIFNFTQGRKPNIGVEAIGGDEGEKLIRVLAPGSQLVLYGSLSLSFFSPTILAYLKEQEIKLTQFHLREWIHSQKPDFRKKTFSDMLITMMEHKVSLPVEQEFKLSSFKEALVAVQQPRRGKIILTCDHSELPNPSDNHLKPLSPM